MYNMINIITTAVDYIWKLLRDEILRVLIARKKNYFFILHLYDIMDIH